MKKIILLLALVGIGFGIQAQKVDTGTKDKKAKKLFDKALVAYQQGKYSDCIANGEKAVKRDGKYIEALNVIAAAHDEMGNLSGAINAYNRIITRRPEYSRGWYYIAQAEFRNTQYQEALDHVSRFFTFPEDPKAENLKLNAQRLKAKAAFAAEAIKHPVDFKPENLGEKVNSKFPEYWPGLNIDGDVFIFTRNINGNEDFFVSRLKDGQWQNSGPLPGAINSASNEGTVSISADGKYVFFTACNRPRGMGSCDIYVSVYSNGEWGTPYVMEPPLNTAAFESQPSISADGYTLYFSSARPGGFGGQDIWRSHLVDGYWDEPENLGPQINTSGDEQAPFLHFDGKTLYFSSDGLPGFGEDDLFVTTLDTGGHPAKPRNLGWPINTGSNEVGLCVDRSGKFAYYASDRKDGFGSLDIYRFELPPDARANKVTYVKGLVYDAATKTPLNAEVTLIDLGTGIPAAKIKTPSSGDFLVVLEAGRNYALNVEAKDYLFFSENFQPTESGIDKPFRVEAPLKKPVAGQSIVLKNTFFDVDKWDIKPESEQELSKLVALMNRFGSMKVEIAGHTDNTGGKEHNKTLSQNRANSVRNWLIAKGISPVRITAKGYGDEKPVADNSTDDGRALNRRTEFVVTGL